MEKRLREISRFFVAPRREFAPAGTNSRRGRSRASTQSVFHKYLHLSTAQQPGEFSENILQNLLEQVAAPPGM